MKITGIADLFRYYSVPTSTPFRFLVGPDTTIFTVHSTLIAHHSKPLGVLVNGNLSEAKGECALLQDVDEGTFVRFSQYAYTEEYIAAAPDILTDSSTITSTYLVPNEASNAQPKPEP